MTAGHAIGQDSPDNASDTWTVIKYGIIWWHPRYKQWVFANGRRYETKEEARDRLAEFTPGNHRVAEQRITYEIIDLGDGS